MKPADLIIFNMSSFQEWESGIVNRNFHVLKNLITRPEIGRILAIDYLPFSLKRGLKSYLESQAFGVKGRVIYRDFTNRLVQVDASRLGRHRDKLYAFSTIDSVVSEGLAMRSIVRAVHKIKLERSMLWSYLPLYTKPFELFKDRLTIFDAVDDWRNHSSYQSQRQKLEHNYTIISEKADCIFTVADDLRLLFGGKKNVHWIPNGVDYERWQGQANFPDDLVGIPAPIIGYAGVIQHRIDLKLLQQIAEKNPNKSFVFVGIVWPDVDQSKLQKLPNVYFLGQKPYNELPRYITHFHIGIIPHKVDPFTKSMNPLKLYEYLACGLPVVSTPVAGLEMFPGMVRIASDSDYFSQQIDEALATDSQEQRLMRKAAVKPHTWTARVDNMLSVIKSQIRH